MLTKEQEAELALYEKTNGVIVLDPQEGGEPNTDVGFADIGKGLAAEIAVATAGNTASAMAAPLTGPFAPLVYAAGSMSSGWAGSALAQEIEGGEFSYGRAWSAAFMNLIPGSKLVKGVNASTEITGALVKEVAKSEAKRGAAIGGAEATATSIIDEGDLPSAERFISGVAVGGLFGAGLGAATPKIAKSFSKLAGKSNDDIDLDIVNGKISEEDLVNVEKVVQSDMFGAEEIKDLDAAYNLNPSKEVSDVDFPNKKIKPLNQEDMFGGEVAPEIKRRVDDLVDKKQSDEATKIFNDAVNGKDGDSAWEKAKRWFSPSLITGRGIQDEVFYANKELSALRDTSSRLAKNIDFHIKNNPNDKDFINRFITTRIIEPEYSGTRLADDLKTFDGELTNLQKKLANQLSTERFGSMTMNEQHASLKAVTNSILRPEQSYSTREYKAFTDVNFKFSPEQKKKAVKEAAKDFLVDNPTATSGAALKAGKQRIDDLIDESALVRNKGEAPESGNTVNRANTGVIRNKKDLGVEQRKFLGEIVDPAERIRGSLDGVAKLVYRNQKDINVVAHLKKLGLVVPNDNKPNDNSFVTLTLPSTINLEGGSKLAVPNSIQQAINQTYSAGTVEDTSNAVERFFKDLYFTSVAGSKVVLVVLNPPSYAVNAYGAMATMVGMGMNPFSKGTAKGLRYALAEYDSVNKIVSGKTSADRRAFAALVKEAKSYGMMNANVLESDIRSTLSSGGVVAESLSKAINPLSKAYSATDTAARIGVWTHNQQRLSKMFPKSTSEQIKMGAAKLTQDTFPIYEKLSPLVRFAQRIGVMAQFVSFTAEFTRNIYNQARFAKQMMVGNFGSELGLDPNLANKNVMMQEGAIRMAGLVGVIAGTEALRRTLNEEHGVTPEVEAMLKDTSVAEYNKGKSLVFDYDPETRTGSYANASYIVPHSIMSEAVTAGFSGEPISNLAELLSSQFVGEGNFVAGNIYRAVDNRDSFGRVISSDPDSVKSFQKRLTFFINETFKPGAVRELDKVVEALNKEDPKFKFSEILARQAGYRITKFNVEESIGFKIRADVQAMQDVKRKYTSARDYSDSSPETIRRLYAESEDVNSRLFKDLITKDKNLRGLGFSEEERIKIHKDSSVSSKDVLGILEGRYNPIPAERKDTTSEFFDLHVGGMKPSEQIRNIKRLTKGDPALRVKLIRHFKSNIKSSKNPLTSRDKLLKNLSSEDKAAMIMDDPAMISYFKRKGMLTKSVILELKSLGYRQ